MSFVKTAYDIARKKVFFCKTTDKISEVARILHYNNIGSILVKDKDKVIGIITVNDMLRQIEKNIDTKKTIAKEIMSSPVRTARKDLEIDELVEEFNKHKVSRMVLLDKNGEVAGVVRDIAVYKYFTFFKYDAQVKKMFAKDYVDRFY
ncbi:MAG: CBS domain-containing protein [archaeon]